MKRLARVLLVGGGLVVGAACWSLFWPIQAYREHGPIGEKASCDGAIGGVENDEVCWDLRNDRRSEWLPVLASGCLIVIAGVAVAVAARSVRAELSATP